MSVEIQTMGEGGIFEIAAVVIDEVLEIQPFTDVEYEILSSARDILAEGSILEAATVATNSANTAAGLASEAASAANNAASAANDAAGLANSATTSANTAAGTANSAATSATSAAGAANSAASSANSAASAANTAAATAASFVGTGPAGYYATLTALQEAYLTGDTGIYVELEYGHWYYWSGSAWTDGGLFQAPLAVVQTTGTSETDVMSQKAVTDEIAQLESDVEQLAYVKIKNEVVNGNFENGLIEPFISSDGSGGVSTLAINSSTPISGNYDSRLTITTPATSGGRPNLFGLHGAGNIGDKIYLHFDTKILSGIPVINGIHNGAVINLIYGGDIINGRNTRIIDVAGIGDTLGRIYFDSTSVWDMQMDNFMRINLTETFGAGNEPTEEEMNLLLDMLPVDYLEGEYVVPQEIIFKWQLALIREVDNEVSQLAGEVFIYEVLGKNKFDKTKYIDNKRLNEIGVINTQIGSKVSQPIFVEAGKSYTASGGFGSLNNHRISFFLDVSGDIDNVAPDAYFNSYSFTAPDNGYIVAWFAVQDADLSDTFQIEEGVVATAYEPFSGKELINEEYLPNYLKESDLKIGAGVNLFNKNGDFIEDLALGSTGGFASAPGALIVDIPLDDKEKTITLQGYKTDGNPHGICFLDESKNVISGSVESFTVEPYFTTEKPDLAKFARIWFKHQNDDIDVLDTFMVSYGTVVKEYIAYEDVLKGIANYPILNDKTNPITRFTLLNIMGDSITYGYSASGQPRLVDYFAKMVAGDIGAILNNYGISGSTIARNSSLPTDRNPMVDRLTDLDLNADIICIAGGTNDWAHNWTPFGEYTDTVPTTFCGALNIICEYLLKNFVGKTVFFSTPIRRDNSDANGQGKTLKDYADAIINIAGEWGIPVVDCYRNVSIIPTLPEHSVLIPDGVHPSIEGHRMMANVITGFIKTK